MGLTFTNSNGVYLENPAADKDGDKAAIILDADGSVSGQAGAYVVANNPLMVTPAGALRSAWNAWVCATPFVQLVIQGANAEVVAPLTLARDDAVATAYVGVPDNPTAVYASLVPARGYAVQYAGAAPDRPRFFVRGSSAGAWLRLSLPYPNPSFNVIRDSDANAPLAAAASLAELDASAGDKYFYDSATATLHLKSVTQTGRTTATLFVVPR